MRTELTYAAEDIYVNVGGGNIECVVYDPPMHGFEKKERVRIQFHSGTSKLCPQGISIETIVARLNGMSVTDQGNFGMWCNGNVEEGLIKQPGCDKKDVAHGPHGIHT